MLFKCASCSYTARVYSNVKRHQLYVHSELKPWECSHPGCHYAAKTKGDLKTHLLLHETSQELRNPFHCTFKGCEYRAANKRRLNCHVKRRHTPDRTRDFPCPICSSRFYDKWDLDAHIRSHVKEKRFPCLECNFKTHLSSTLWNHIRNVHQRAMNFTCPFPGCNFRSNWMGALSRHLKRHNPDPHVRHPFPYTFSTASPSGPSSNIT